MKTLRLYWHSYDYLPYEKELALREVRSVLDPAFIEPMREGVIAHDCSRPDSASGLVYFRASVSAGLAVSEQPTQQYMLESTASRTVRRQATRYSVHGLHEYKGKFNPQTAQALLNIADLRQGQAVLDPYCGSGTTLLEAMHRGSIGLGFDANPFAVLLTETKAKALATPARRLAAGINRALRLAVDGEASSESLDRADYLARWLPAETLQTVERLRAAAARVDDVSGAVLCLLVSDLLRDYSLQEPQDLRVRRRRSPLPGRPFVDELRVHVNAFIERLNAAQSVLKDQSLGEVRVASANIATATEWPSTFGTVEIGALVTSPPYAMALPYIDTQRISLVWLGLVDSKELRTLESQLTGSREIGPRERREGNEQIDRNCGDLPDDEANLCQDMLASLGDADGFRRQAMPSLLYRYFEQMAGMFGSVRGLVEADTPYFLVVGHNQTTLNHRLFRVDTPGHLANLAQSNGWSVEDVVPLQAYRRFGLHARNAVAVESLLHLSAK